MTATEWVEENYQDIHKWLSNITKGESPDLLDDFVQEIVMIFLEHEDADLLVEQDDAKWFIIRIGMNQWRSSTSPFDKTYRKHSQMSDYGDYDFSLRIPHEHNPYKIEKELMTLTVFRVLEDLRVSQDPLERYYWNLLILYFTVKCNYSEVSRRLDKGRKTVKRDVKEAHKLFKTLAEPQYQKLYDDYTRTIKLDYSIHGEWSTFPDSINEYANTISFKAFKSGIFKDL